MKGEAHKHITKEVLKKYADDLGFAEEDIYWIVFGTGTEDWTSPIARLTNWHFYRANLDIPTYIILRKPTSERRIKKLIKRFNWTQDNKSRLTILGRVIHHIQDMCTPTHVVPIYHSLKIKDPYEVNMMKHIDEEHMDFISSIDTDVTPSNLFEIYIKNAKLSLKHLRNEKVPLNQQESDMSFDEIWTPYPKAKAKHKGFGDFGQYSDCFDVNKSTHIDTHAIYEHFTIQAAQATYDALKYYVENIK